MINMFANLFSLLPLSFLHIAAYAFLLPLGFCLVDYWRIKKKVVILLQKKRFSARNSHRIGRDYGPD